MQKVLHCCHHQHLVSIFCGFGQSRWVQYPWFQMELRNHLLFCKLPLFKFSLSQINHSYLSVGFLYFNLEFRIYFYLECIGQFLNSGKQQECSFFFFSLEFVIFFLISPNQKKKEISHSFGFPILIQYGILSLYLVSLPLFGTNFLLFRLMPLSLVPFLFCLCFPFNSGFSFHS